MITLSRLERETRACLADGERIAPAGYRREVIAETLVLRLLCTVTARDGGGRRLQECSSPFSASSVMAE